MHFLRSHPLTGFALAAAVPWLAAPAAAQPAPEAPLRGQAATAPMELTTDTQEYCTTLANRLSGMIHYAAVPPPREVSILSSEGQRMCALGQIRPGIMRLRKALTLMMQDGAASR
jgi:hypothetical protein